MSNHDAIKKELRVRFRALRASFSQAQKEEWDAKLRAHFLALPAYRDCAALLCYVPLPGEIDTIPLLEDAWERGKTVAVPYCVPGTRTLAFYRVNSLAALNVGAFGVREPDPAREEKLADYRGALCLVPGLAYDRNGYRLGYGGGYYDRFLSGPFAGRPTVGACYEACLVEQMTRDNYDMPCDILLTENGAVK